MIIAKINTSQMQAPPPPPPPPPPPQKKTLNLVLAINKHLKVAYAQLPVNLLLSREGVTK